MKKEWMEYYVYLEELRKSGITNMFGAAPYLQDHFNLEYEKAKDILSNWMKNYSSIIKEIKKEF